MSFKASDAFGQALALAIVATALFALALAVTHAWPSSASSLLTYTDDVGTPWAFSADRVVAVTVQRAQGVAFVGVVLEGGARIQLVYASPAKAIEVCAAIQKEM